MISTTTPTCARKAHPADPMPHPTAPISGRRARCRPGTRRSRAGDAQRQRSCCSWRRPAARRSAAARCGDTPRDASGVQRVFEHDCRGGGRACSAAATESAAARPAGSRSSHTPQQSTQGMPPPAPHGAPPRAGQQQTARLARAPVYGADTCLHRHPRARPLPRDFHTGQHTSSHRRRARPHALRPECAADHEANPSPCYTALASR